MKIAKEKIITFFLTIVIIFSLFPRVALANPNQVFINNNLPGFALTAAAYGNSTYIAVGSNGYIITSTDGLNWGVAGDSSKFKYNYQGVAFGNGVLIATGAGGKIVKSADNGATWNEVTSGTTNNLGKVIYTGSKFYVVGNDVVLTSTNGDSWSLVNMGVSGKQFGSVAYGNNTFVIGDTDGNIYYSTNETTWTQIKLSNYYSSSNVNFIKYLNGKFYAGNANAGLYTSTNGTSWTSVGAPFRVDNTTGGCAQAFSAMYDGSQYYFIGFDGNSYGGVITSPSGTSSFSTQSSSRSTTMTVSDALYANGVYIQVGGDGLVVSTNGTDWRYAIANASFNSVAYDGSKYVAVGNVSSDGVVYTSTDYSTWSLQNVKLPNILLNSVAYGNGKYVAVGNVSSNNNGRIYISSDGQSWTPCNPPNTEALTKVTYGNGLFVAVGSNGNIISSPNGENWTSNYSSPGLNFNAVAFVNNQFVACGDSGLICKSANGINWEDCSYLDTPVNFNGVAYGPGNYVFVGVDANNGNAFTLRSDDSMTYSLPASQVSGLSSIQGVVYSEQEGMFMAVSNDSNGNAFVTTSTDGNSWTNINCNNTSYISGISYLNNNFRVVGSSCLAMSANNTMNSNINPKTASFDKYTAKQADVITNTELNGNTLSSIKNGTSILASGTDYIVSGNTVTINKSYLAQEAVGTLNLTFNFSAGLTQNLSINVNDTTPTPYTVNFKDSDGSNIDSQTVLGGNKATTPTAPTKTGYNFDGWYKEAVCQNPWDFANDVVTANTDLFAKWTIKSYNVSFDSQGGNVVTGTTANYEEKVTAPTAPTRTGYTFGGWYKEATCQNLWNFAADTVTADTTMYAKWTINSYTVTFKDYNGTTIGTPQSVNYGGNATAPADPTREGYNFTSWDMPFNNVTGDLVVTAEYSINQYTLTYVSGANGSITGSTSQTVNWGTDGTEVTAAPATGYHFVSWSDLATNATRKDTNVIASKSVTAQFAINSYNVNYDSQGGNAVTGTTANYGEKVTAPTAPTRTGYTFGGWYKEAACQNPWNFAADTVTADTTMYAKWTINSYTVTFEDYNGTTIGTPQSVNYGGSATAPTGLTRAGYIFTGWDKTFNNVTGDLVVTAKYTINQYTLAYTAGANGSITGTANQTVNWGTDGTEVTAVPAIGYHFVSWNDLVTSATRKDTNVIASISLTAQFAINNYNVNYDSQGANAVTGTTANYGEKVTAPTAPTKTGYTFGGWYKEAACQNPWNFATDTVTADTTMYAKWTINSYTVTFKDYNGTTIGTPQSVNYGSNTVAPVDPTRTGYVFAGWDKTFNNVTGDLVVTAKYTINQYTLTYVSGANGSITGTASQTVNWGTDGTEVTAVPAIGYHFVSWNDLVTSATRKDTNVIASISLTAQFAINNYNVNYDSQGGNAVTGTTANYGEKVTAPTAPTKTGYTFGGWYKEAACQNPWNFAADTVTADTTMYAKWTINSYTVTFEDYNDTIIGTSQSVTYGSNAVAPVDPTRTGYVFAGWDNEFKNITGDLVVKAKYTSGNTYTFPSTTTSDNIAEVKTPIGYVQSGDNTLVINNNNANLSIPASVIDMTGVSGSDYIKITEKVVNNTSTGTMALFSNLPNSVQMVGSPLSLNIQLFDANDNLIKDIHQFANNQKVKVTIKLTSDEIKGLDTSKLSMYYYDETKKEWIELGGSYDAATMEFTFYTTHFTNFAIMQTTATNTNLTTSTSTNTTNSAKLVQTGSKVDFDTLIEVGIGLIFLGAAFIVVRKRKIN